MAFGFTTGLDQVPQFVDALQGIQRGANRLDDSLHYLDPFKATGDYWAQMMPGPRPSSVADLSDEERRAIRKQGFGQAMATVGARYRPGGLGAALLAGAGAMDMQEGRGLERAQARYDRMDAERSRQFSDLTRDTQRQMHQEDMLDRRYELEEQAAAAEAEREMQQRQAAMESFNTARQDQGLPPLDDDIAAALGGDELTMQQALTEQHRRDERRSKEIAQDTVAGVVSSRLGMDPEVVRAFVRGGQGGQLVSKMLNPSDGEDTIDIRDRDPVTGEWRVISVNTKTGKSQVIGTGVHGDPKMPDLGIDPANLMLLSQMGFIDQGIAERGIESWASGLEQTMRRREKTMRDLSVEPERRNRNDMLPQGAPAEGPSPRISGGIDLGIVSQHPAMRDAWRDAMDELARSEMQGSQIGPADSVEALARYFAGAIAQGGMLKGLDARSLARQALLEYEKQGQSVFEVP